MRNPQFREIVGMKTYPMRFKDGSTRIIRNRNEFLESGFSGANGIKTGMTDAAGKCLLASAIRNGNLMVVSVYNDNARWQDVQSWLTYGFTCAEACDRYQKELKAEPIVFKWVNQVMGREPNEEQTKKVQKTEVRPYKVSIAIVILLFILILAPRVYQVYELHEQITQAELRKEQLVKEKQELDMKKKELNDSRVIEDKARHELGLVKPSEVPYVP